LFTQRREAHSKSQPKAGVGKTIRAKGVGVAKRKRMRYWNDYLPNDRKGGKGEDAEAVFALKDEREQPPWVDGGSLQQQEKEVTGLTTTTAVHQKKKGPMFYGQK